MRLIRFACLIGCLAAPASVLAHDGPLCGSPEVLGAVARLLAQAGSGARIADVSVGQVPTARQDTVLCAVRVLDRFYDTNRFGLDPLVRPEVFEYTVRRAGTGVLVSPVGTRRG